MSPRTIQILTLFGRYGAAIILSIITSFAALFLSMSLAFYLGQTLRLEEITPYVVFPLVGFSGVLSGTFCLQRSSRGVGSVILLVLGLAYYCYFWVGDSYIRGEYRPRDFPHFWALAVGGLGAITFFLLRRSLDAKTG